MGSLMSPPPVPETTASGCPVMHPLTVSQRVACHDARQHRSTNGLRAAGSAVVIDT
jgi:hypothetical protein